MAQQADSRETRKPESRPESRPDSRPARDDSTVRKDPPKLVIREIYSDWAMI